MDADDREETQRVFLAPDGTEIAYREFLARAVVRDDDHDRAPRPPLVILHGLAGSSREFVPTARALAPHRVVLVDQRGHGRSTRVPTDVSREAFVADVIGVIEHVVGGPVVLVGQSMGGHTALLVAAARPDLVRALLLLEAGVGGDGDEGRRAELRAFFASWPVPFSDRAAATAFLGDGPLERAWVDDLEASHDGLRPRFDADVMVDVIAAVDERPRWETLPRLTMPHLLVFGERGMFEAAQQFDLLQRAPDVRSVGLLGAGHDAHLDTPDVWFDVLRGFVTSVEPQSD
ncbi:alpha/beta hydrolase [Agromyces protaetiae]|uniref:Alpha/beta hydrolase n=1 Tax=Agromyces protaetiae TaxID=2509455 RepID=A0A4P6FDQ6_9MICO|nr:alpha/beta hydrolase [Agromyces protaetiae]QAY74025.1 alpha/beta hydrolase [Agromyces protaetiae]